MDRGKVAVLGAQHAEGTENEEVPAILPVFPQGGYISFEEMGQKK